ncbi:DUF6338 family protein [Longivirga aurantiaca]|uniref:DUF6338 family protein n=1 Tax=Longivirga aurantiaca TaxID=1837743 RepID=A0ABW1SX31_9ACTN
MPDSWVALLIALLAVVPGFLTVTIWARSRTWRGPTGDLRTILQALAISAVIQVVLFPLTVMVVLPHWRSPDDYAVSLGAWLLLTVLAFPVVLGLGTARLTDWVFPLRTADTNFGWLRRFLRGAIKPVAPPTMWDWWLTEGVPNGRFVLAKFRDGSYIGGVFSDGSMALTSPEPHGIYLASEWLVDEAGDFVGEIPQTGGVLLPLREDILWLRVQGDNGTSEVGDDRA